MKLASEISNLAVLPDVAGYRCIISISTLLSQYFPAHVGGHDNDVAAKSGGDGGGSSELVIESTPQTIEGGNHIIHSVYSFASYN
jgi:hypothetical protein